MSVVADVRAGFVRQGKSLRSWCRSNGIDPGYAHKVLAGRTNGPAALALKERITEASSREANEQAA
jgi:hypothetical protein